MRKIEVDCQTGKTTERDLTSAELADLARGRTEAAFDEQAVADRAADCVTQVEAFRAKATAGKVALADLVEAVLVLMERRGIGL